MIIIDNMDSCIIITTPITTITTIITIIIIVIIIITVTIRKVLIEINKTLIINHIIINFLLILHHHHYKGTWHQIIHKLIILIGIKNNKNVNNS